VTLNAELGKTKKRIATKGLKVHKRKITSAAVASAGMISFANFELFVAKYRRFALSRCELTDVRRSY
jgi:hypothetical protein